MSEVDDNKLIEAILASGVKIPPMPAILHEVQALERNDDAGPREYAALLSRDPALAGALFRVVGSPVMGLRTRVESLEKAITVLGLKTSAAVIRSEGLRGALQSPELGAVMQKLWQRMNAIADLVLATCKLARLRQVREDLLYQAAIFHDCGIAVICRRDLAYAKAFQASGGWPDPVALDLKRHTNHGVVGQMVARNWQLPQEVALAVRHHHDPRIEGLPLVVQSLIILLQFACHMHAKRTGGEDAEWQAVWQGHAEALFHAVGHGLPDLEEAVLNRVP